MDKLHQITTNPSQITALTITDQGQLKGGMASMDEEKTAKTKKVKV
jgi:hypothetical protein